MIFLIISLLGLLIKAYKPNVSVSYKCKTDGKTAEMKEVLLSTSKKDVDGSSRNVFLFKITFLKGLNKEMQILIDEKGFIEKLRVTDRDHKKIYEITKEEETLLNIYNETGDILKEIPAQNKDSDGIFFPDLPASWHYLLKELDILKTEKFKLRMHIPLYTDDAGAGSIDNAAAAQTTGFNVVNVSGKIKSRGEEGNVISISPFKIEVTIDKEYNVTRLTRGGYEITL